MIHKKPKNISLSPSYLGTNINEQINSITTRNNFETQNNENQKDNPCLKFLNNLLSEPKNIIQANYYKCIDNKYLSPRENYNYRPKIIKCYDDKENNVNVNISENLNNNYVTTTQKNLQCKNKNEMKKLIK